MSSENKNMDDFDWVKALSSCSLSIVFERLRQDVENDVKTRNELRVKDLRADGFGYEFSFTGGSYSFKVILDSNQKREVVTFKLGDKSISATDSQGDLLFDATLTLNDEGECRLKIEGEEHDLWHVRRMALEHIFFGIY